MKLAVERWAFWSPETERPEQWRSAAPPAPFAAAAAGVPADLIPSSHRRRMSGLSKAAVQTALRASEGVDVDYLVFCSRHGELTRTSALLAAIATETELSPTDFSQSVHNTSSGLFSIIERTHVPACSLASGSASFAYAWMESEAFLAEHADARVLLVDSDDAVPAEFAAFLRSPSRAYALALVLRRNSSAGVDLEVASGGDADAPVGPAFLRWWLSGERTLALDAEDQRFVWERSGTQR